MTSNNNTYTLRGEDDVLTFICNEGDKFATIYAQGYLAGQPSAEMVEDYGLYNTIGVDQGVHRGKYTLINPLEVTLAILEK